MKFIRLLLFVIILLPFIAVAEDSSSGTPKQKLLNKDSSPEEIAAALKARREHFDHAMTVIYDKNNDGKLDDDERAKMKADLAAHRTAFIQKFDKNGDGKLDEEEMAAVRKQIREDRAEFIRKFDKNGDGKLDEEESAALRKELEQKRGEFMKDFDRIDAVRSSVQPR